MIVAIVLARGGSKGIPKKNIIDFCGKPLMAWTIEHCAKGGADLVYVSSDSEEILAVGEQYGALPIRRPLEISGDTASSESGWLHALSVIEDVVSDVDWILAPQVTSPLREIGDITGAINLAQTNEFDSLFSATVVEDFCLWRKSKNGLESFSYDYRDRKPRQLFEKTILENGSFYLFRPNILKEHNNRLANRIGYFLLDRFKSFQIDSKEDLRIAKSIMIEFGLDK